MTLWIKIASEHVSAVYLGAVSLLAGVGQVRFEDITIGVATVLGGCMAALAILIYAIRDRVMIGRELATHQSDLVEQRRRFDETQTRVDRNMSRIFALLDEMRNKSEPPR